MIARLVSALALPLMTLVAGPAGASQDRLIDSLATQTFRLDPLGHPSMVRAVAEPRPHADSLSDRAKDILLISLGTLESTCRSKLWPKEEEPGSPWLLWRSLGHLDRDGCAWYAGAISCTDSLCGSELVLHDRLALLCVGRDRSEVTLLPGEPSTMRDEETADVDSVAFFRGKDCTLVQARRRLSNDHPCLGVIDPEESEEALFAVLRGDRVVQAFALVPSASWVSHDDVDGDSGVDREGTLRVTADAVQMEYRIEEWSEVPGGDATKVARKVTQRGLVRLEYSPKAGRFIRTR